MTIRSTRAVSILLSTLLALSLGLAQGAQAAEVPAQIRAEAKSNKLPRSEAKARPTLKMGSEGAWVKSVQRALQVRPKNGVFGKATGKSVRKFRKEVGLRPKKKVNTRTWRHLGDRVKVPKSALPGKSAPKAPPATPAPSPPADVANYPTLRRGDTSAWVRALQTALGIVADGDFGPNTETAVRDYQAAAGLPVSGIVTSDTWSRLGARVIPPAVDITTTEAARTSRAHRSTISVDQFVNSATARLVVQRESGGNCAIVSSNGKWHGKWQMDANFWSGNGGLAYATKASKATCAQQDLVARAGWIDRWWNPWPTAL
ncbi:peptidoglycan-binding protein [Candidatus Nanopelagicales bacterium]|nr:peptidoglycan-binding protein [Candidatus Nanopelagicales bacterium]